MTYDSINLPPVAWGLDSIRAFIPWAKANGSRAFIISDLIYDDFGYHSRVSQLLKTAGIDSIVFSDISYKNDYDDIKTIAEVFYASRADIVVGLGGSNAMSIARIIASSSGMPERLALMLNNKPDTPGTAFAAIPVAFRMPYLFSDKLFLRTGPDSSCLLHIADSSSIVIADYYFLNSMPKKTATVMLISLIADNALNLMDSSLHSARRAFSMESLRITGKICEKSIIIEDSDDELFAVRKDQMDAGMLSSMAFSSYSDVSLLSSALYAVSGVSRSWISSVLFCNYLSLLQDAVPSGLLAACEALGLIGLEEDIAASELSRFTLGLLERAGFAVRLRDFGISQEQLDESVQLAVSCGGEQSSIRELAARSF